MAVASATEVRLGPGKGEFAGRPRLGDGLGAFADELRPERIVGRTEKRTVRPRAKRLVAPLAAEGERQGNVLRKLMQSAPFAVEMFDDRTEPRDGGPGPAG